MKYRIIIIFSIILMASCTASVTAPVTDPLPGSTWGKWNFTAKQAPGPAGPGEWSVAPTGYYITIDSIGHIGGNLFTDVTSYQLIDSATVKFIAPSQSAGFYLFNYKFDTEKKALFLYIRPSNGGYCIEGCGAYRFER